MDSSTVQYERVALKKGSKIYWQKILISCKKIYKDINLNCQHFVFASKHVLSLHCHHCKVQGLLTSSSPVCICFFLFKEVLCFHDCSHFLILITASTECIDLFSPIHYKANRGESHHTWIQKLQFPDVTRGSDYSAYHNQFLNICIIFHTHCKVGFPTKGTRTKCSRKVRDIESGPWQGWLGWRGWWMIICKRLVIYVSGSECIGRCGQLPSKGARFVWYPSVCEDCSNKKLEQ